MSLPLRQSLCWLVLAGLACTPIAGLVAAPGEGAKGLAFSIVSGGGTVARVRVERVYRDQQTRGFFKIGILPKWVAEGVDIRCWEVGHLAEVISTARGLAPSGPVRGAFEFKRVSIAMAEDVVPRLRAGRVRFRGPNAWELLESVSWQQPGGSLTSAPEAVLIISGPTAGLLSARVGTNQVRADLFVEVRSKSDSQEPSPP